MNNIKNSLMAIAAITAVSAPLANASVQVYGKVHVSIDYVESDATDAFWSVSSNSSRIGFKGTEDLGNGLSLIWKAETTYDFSDGGAWGDGRNAYIGLAGDWGSFLYGIHDTAMKMSTARLDLFADTIADYDEAIDFDDERKAQNIVYISPNMNGLTIAANMSTETDDGPDGEFDGSYAIAAMYSNNGLYLSAAYEYEQGDVDGANLPDKTVDPEHNWRVGIGYDVNNVHLGFVYEDTDDAESEPAVVWQVSGSYAFGNSVVKAMYGAEDYDDGDNTEYGWAVGLDHNLSKRSKVYAVYVDTDNDIKNHDLGGDDQKGFALGMIHNF